MILSSLKSLTDRYLGASYVYVDDKKTAALNQARKWLLSNYDITETIRTADLAFTSGIASIPSNYLRTVRLFYSSTGEYWVRVNENDFDLNVAKTYTVKWNETNSDYRFYFYPADTRTIKLRYVYLPTDMSSDSDDSGLSTWWDECLSCYAAYQILLNDRQPEAQNKLIQFKDLVRMAMKNQQGDQKESMDFQSIYDSDYSLLGSENG